MRRHEGGRDTGEFGTLLKNVGGEAGEKGKNGKTDRENGKGTKGGKRTRVTHEQFAVGGNISGE